MTGRPIGAISEAKMRNGQKRALAAIDPVTQSRNARARLAELKDMSPTQQHPRQCRCDRPILTADGCAKCGLPETWEPATLPELVAIAELVRRDQETHFRRLRNRRRRKATG